MKIKDQPLKGFRKADCSSTKDHDSRDFAKLPHQCWLNDEHARSTFQHHNHVECPKSLLFHLEKGLTVGDVNWSEHIQRKIDQEKQDGVHDHGPIDCQQMKAGKGIQFPPCVIFSWCDVTPCGTDKANGTNTSASCTQKTLAPKGDFRICNSCCHKSSCT